MKSTLAFVLIGCAVALLHAASAAAQVPNSVICQFEKIATAGVDSSGKVIAGGEDSKGELVISNLNSDAPVGSGNLGAAKLHVLRRFKDAICLAEITSNEVAGVITLFFKSGIVMYTKHEILHTLTNGDKPFGFVEIGRFRALR